jgi:excinuclease ABC subunit C
MPFDPIQLEQYPHSAGVYIMKNKTGKVLYVGKAKSLKKRLKQYFAPGRDTRPTIPLLLAELHFIDTISLSTEKEALLLENMLIKQHKPKFNVLLKDDKTYVSLSIDPKASWPRLQLTRFKIEPQGSSYHFGPYTSALAAKETFELMARLFPLRQCSDDELKKRTRPCILYSIKRCIAPCVSKCTKEEYGAFVQSAIDFLQGNSGKILKELRHEMEKAADSLEFETAAAYLRTIRQIEHVTQTKTIFETSHGKEIDVIGLYREADKVVLALLSFRQGKLVGQETFPFESIMEEDEELLSSFLLQHYHSGIPLPKEILLPLPLLDQEALLSIFKESHPQKTAPRLHIPRVGDRKKLIELAQKNANDAFHQKQSQKQSLENLLLDLQETLGLTRFPKTLECFDTSNLSGSHLVAASVCFTNGEEERKKMKLYHLKGIDKSDDYEALRQVLTRRMVRAKKEEDFPDLLIIDGGKGQLNVALEVLKNQEIAGIDVISLSKEEGRHDKGITLEKIHIPGKDSPLSLPFHSPLLFFLQKVRDKAHEKAISFYRKTHLKKTLSSALSSIHGIGPTKEKRLLQQFGSLQNILVQTEEALSQVRGITQKDLIALKNFSKKQM